MTDTEKLRELQARMDSLLRKHEDFAREINNLRQEINNIKPAGEPTPEIIKAPFPPATETPPIAVGMREKKPETPLRTPPPQFNTPPPVYKPKVKSDLEKFIGENLINKIGIAITVIGVGIGAKYSIDHNLISPLARIILGYLAGITLLLFGIRLKKNYENFSAVLVSGAIAIMYFITFAAYAVFGLIPQALAFSMMVIFTAFTVVAAVKYNLQVIAHIGLVGAYAVPFLLSDGSGRVVILFSYMAIINAGILVLSFWKYWKPLFYSSFGLTWLIVLSWYLTGYRTDTHFTTALIFITIFFSIFYTAFLAYKLKKKEKFDRGDITLMLLNSFIFYATGYSIFDSHHGASQFTGVFTLGNAVMHFIACAIVYRQKLADRNLFYLVAGLVLVFITIAIPVQLDGNWVTLLWAGEAALLYYIGRTRNVSFYEKLSYPMMFIAFFSLCDDWSSFYGSYHLEFPELWIRPFFNIQFLTSILFVAAFAFINRILVQKGKSTIYPQKNYFSKLVSIAIPSILLISIYYSFRIEISNHFQQLFRGSELKIARDDSEYYIFNTDYRHFRTVWTANYSMLFVSLLSFINLRKIKDTLLAHVNIVLNLVAIISFLMMGLFSLSELRENYISQPNADYFHHGSFNLGIRYLSFVFLGLAVYSCYLYRKSGLVKYNLPMHFDFLLHATLIWISSSELIHWLDLAGSTQSYKLGLSILWGSYSLLLIVIGIWKKKKHLRIGAIVLFGLTLIKLFFYDISHLDTIAKTVVFLSLGILLLIISFLYNKYKHQISDESN